MLLPTERHNLQDNIALTATGLLTSLGEGVQANVACLKGNQDGLAPLSLLDTVHRGAYYTGEIKLTDEELKKKCGLSPNFIATRGTLLSALALNDLKKQLPTDFFNAKKYAFINASTGGGMSSVEAHYQEFITLSPPAESIPYIQSLDAAESTNQALQIAGLQPQYISTISTACSSSANAIIVGAQLVRHGLADAVICGGCDAFSRFTINGFLSLKNVDKEKCTPFDAQRKGLNLGEGAGYVLIERLDNALARGAQVLGILSGYSNCNDAYHPTAPSPDGSAAQKTMQLALEKAKLNAQDIDYINAHGTATESNDASELKAIENLFGSGAKFSSTKTFIGHTLAAAGAIEAIYSLFAIGEQTLWGNLRWQHPMPECPQLEPVRNAQARVIRHAISNSFGFGGNNVSLILSAYHA